ncbi:MAG: hypothetical protein FJW39_02710 [Acidobacteria bacterium]|nr:hypothetical protein [Acidobacteriota bacterium]
MTRRTFLASAAAAPVALARGWEHPAFPDWDAGFVDKVLTDSPWARSITSPFLFLKRSVRTELYLTTRFSSALPVRQALAIAEFGRAGLGQPGARALLDREPAGYLVETGGFLTTMFPSGAKALEEELLKTARLYTAGRRPVHAIEVSVPEHGMHLAASIRFPRFEGLDMDKGVIEFAGEAGKSPFVQRFKLRDMFYRGRLEL